MNTIKKWVTLLTALLFLSTMFGTTFLLIVVGLMLIITGALPTLTSVVGIYLVSIGFTIILGFASQNEIKEVFAQYDEETKK